MNSIVVNPKNEKELRFVSKLLKKLGVDSKVLTDEQQEDFGLTVLMKEVDRSEIASKDEVMKKLRG